MNQLRIKVNRAQCRKCGMVLVSLTRHDFRTCDCGAISVDGGRAYLKRSAQDMDDVKELSEYEPDEAGKHE